MTDCGFSPAFSRLAGFGGLVVCLDELVNLYKLQNAQARKQNYEQILRILNDVLQGTTEGLGFVFGGTPEFLYDTRRGLYSYEAASSRASPPTVLRSTASPTFPDRWSGSPISRRRSSIICWSDFETSFAARRSGTPSPARRSAPRLHGALPEADRRGLFPHAAQHGEGIPSISCRSWSRTPAPTGASGSVWSSIAVDRGGEVESLLPDQDEPDDALTDLKL